MQLIDSLRKLADTLPPSHIPSLNELAGIVGATIAHAEHGESILQAAEHGAEEVARVLAPVAADAIDAAVPVAAPLVGVAEQAAVSELSHLESSAGSPAAAPAAAQSAPPSDAEVIAELRKQLEAAQTQIAAQQRGAVVSRPADPGAAA